ncbi:MAG: chemotaxis protein CheW [Gemmataceae bacterium]
MKPIPVVNDCWNRIGVRGDRSCPELPGVGHCHNCPVFSAAGRGFLDAPSPEGYREEWTRRLAPAIETEASDRLSVFLFRLDEEWLALPVGVLVEVTTPRPVHRVPHRGGLLAGIVNIRGELQLQVKIHALLGIPSRETPRFLLVVRHDNERWVLPVDEVDQVRRIPINDLKPPPATLQRASTALTRGVFCTEDHAVGLLDETRLWAALRTRVR